MSFSNYKTLHKIRRHLKIGHIPVAESKKAEKFYAWLPYNKKRLHIQIQSEQKGQNYTVLCKHRPMKRQPSFPFSFTLAPPKAISTFAIKSRDDDICHAMDEPQANFYARRIFFCKIFTLCRRKILYIIYQQMTLPLIKPSRKLDLFMTGSKSGMVNVLTILIPRKVRTGGQNRSEHKRIPRLAWKGTTST